uniref:Galectin n=1 Tax=Meloidogyne hapla TaxID=6305 RepID=A0A1I8AWJ1_MELHA
MGNKIIIKGRIPEGFKNITVNFLHGAVKWHPYVGTTVLQLNIKRNISCLNSYAYNHKHYRWLSGLPGDCQNHLNLEEGQRIRISINQINDDNLKSDIETEENIIEMFYRMLIPLSMTEYIEVIIIRA